MEQIFILLGTNEGNLPENLAEALARIRKKRIKILKKSRIYRTKPWGNPDQPHFLNMAIEVRCEYAPDELLGYLKEIEKSMGRTKKNRWSSRIIDLDILFYGRRTVKNRNLIIPHKAVYDRPFALLPLAEIADKYLPPRRSKILSEYARKMDHAGITVYRN